jgi:hypothetical protein
MEKDKTKRIIVYSMVCILVVTVLIVGLISGHTPEQDDTDCFLCAETYYECEECDDCYSYGVRFELLDDISGNYIQLTPQLFTDTWVIEEFVVDYPEIIIILYEEPGGYRYWIRGHEYNTLQDFTREGLYKFYVTEKVTLIT